MARISKALYLTILMLLLYVPIFILVVNSFNASKYGIKWTGFSTKWYEKLVQNDALIQAALNSLTVSIIAATMATVIGTLAAVALYRYDFKGKKFLSGMVFVSMLTPDIVMAIALLIVFITLGISLGFISLLIAHITFCLPFVIIAVYARLNDFDKRMILAARDLGASEWRIFRLVILPLILPAVVSGWLLSFTLSLDDVIVSAFVTGPGYEILPLKVYSMVKVGVSPEVNAISTILLVVSLLIVIASQLIVRKDKTL
ncbi:spermidine/putrescine ABC transporter permease PotC [Catenovulum sp. 2E275]|uniref:spermidine/putrescine ABC transporter permease PotC n=1 Tax=Catenovulum sp. 2E275 TaxID=2980497 RepID=UPI0021D2DA83|nr:spermidine/putrescine ABC transporter permease PotC [Catenovulum sp. 2E275]MCU4677049.1 spermidine/putrescine ABC transporter permease PotC [Catenovulum sp. 2E275]